MNTATGNVWAALIGDESVNVDIPGLRCPVCNGVNFRVQQTLPGMNGTVRRRVCNTCEHHFVTEERVAPAETYNFVQRITKKQKRQARKQK